MRSVASVKDRLKNRSKETGGSLQELFTVYGLERTIYRLSISRYLDNFTLKGGILLYALFEGNYARATTDIDFLARKISNETEDMKAVLRNGSHSPDDRKMLNESYAGDKHHHFTSTFYKQESISKQRGGINES